MRPYAPEVSGLIVGALARRRWQPQQAMVLPYVCEGAGQGAGGGGAVGMVGVTSCVAADSPGVRAWLATIAAC